MRYRVETGHAGTECSIVCEINFTSGVSFLGFYSRSGGHNVVDVSCDN